MRRLLYDQLVRWKGEKTHKPIVLEGVRQCGKTYLLTEFGANEFDGTVYCNFEQFPKLKELFTSDMDPYRIVRDMELYFNTKVVPGKTLLILDEIQECDAAITSLKYFCEGMPDLHIACAGSLLGIMKSKASFPVGKVRTEHLYPMNFCEFLIADGQEALAEFILSDPDQISEPIHSKLLRYLTDYCVVGGMPEAVASWVSEHDITKVDEIQKELLKNYAKDFAKHGGSMVEKLTSVWRSVPSFLSRENHRFVFGELKKDGRAGDFADPVQWLENAHMIYRINRIRGHAFPPSTEEDEEKYKLYLCDVGLLRAMTGHPAGMMLSEDDETRLYKGGLFENLAVNEMISAGAERLFYWREGKYEVDLIAAIGGRTVPMDVKAGVNFSTVSLNRYQKDYDVPWSIVISKRVPRKGDREYIPIYAAGNMFRRR